MANSVYTYSEPSTPASTTALVERSDGNDYFSFKPAASQLISVLPIDSPVPSLPSTPGQMISSYEVDWEGPEDPENPRNWPKWRKALLLGALSLGTFLYASIMLQRLV